MNSITKNIAVLFVIALFFSCAKKDPDQELKEILKAHAQTNINEFILDEFKDHRVIMLADAGHGWEFYLRNVTSFLNFWLGAAKTDKNTLQNLVLVLERDSVDVERIKKYASTHNLRDFIDEKPIFPSDETIGDLEFYWELGDLLRRIDDYRKSGGNLSLTILGPEMVIDLDNWSFAKRDSFFVNERDIISSNAIINCLKANPDSRALIYYGGGHFVENEVQKLDNKESKGYFLAHYLRKEFGSQLYRIGQYRVAELANYSVSFSRPDTSYIIDMKHIHKFFNPQQVYEATLVLYGYIEPTISFISVKSKNLGYLALDDLKTLFPIKNDYYFVDGVYAAAYLSVLTGGMESVGHASDRKLIMASVPGWERWLNNPNNDVVKDIIAQKSKKRLLDLIKSMDKSISRHSAYLFNLDTGQEWSYNFRNSDEGRDEFYDDYDLDDSEYRAIRLENYKKYIKDYDKKIVVTDLVNLLWVGTDLERQEAVDALREKTGQILTTAPEWMAWWRANYRGL